MRPARLAVVMGMFAVASACAQTNSAADAGPSVADTRVVLDKWIETQQILARERKDWQQGKELLQSRVELVSKEMETLDEKIKQAEAKAADVDKSRKELESGIAELKSTGARMAETVTRLEAGVRRIYAALPDPLSARIKPLYDRMPANPAETKISAAERFQNVLGILNEVTKANSEITLTYEVRTLAGGKPAEVRVIYVGLAQAYYLSAGGETGIGVPSPDGWKWEPAAGLSHNIRKAMEILEGKQPPAFVPLPCTLQ